MLYCTSFGNESSRSSIWSFLAQFQVDPSARNRMIWTTCATRIIKRSSPVAATGLVSSVIDALHDRSGSEGVVGVRIGLATISVSLITRSFPFFLCLIRRADTALQ